MKKLLLISITVFVTVNQLHAAHTTRKKFRAKKRAQMETAATLASFCSSSSASAAAASAAASTASSSSSSSASAAAASAAASTASSSSSSSSAKSSSSSSGAVIPTVFRNEYEAGYCRIFEAFIESHITYHCVDTNRYCLTADYFPKTSSYSAVFSPPFSLSGDTYIDVTESPLKYSHKDAESTYKELEARWLKQQADAKAKQNRASTAAAATAASSASQNS